MKPRKAPTVAAGPEAESAPARCLVGLARAPYEELECCLITLREALTMQRQTTFTAHAVATIDRTLARR